MINNIIESFIFLTSLSNDKKRNGDTVFRLVEGCAVVLGVPLYIGFDKSEVEYLADIEYDGKSGNFCIMSRKAVANFRLMGEQLRFFGGLVQWIGFPTASIEVEKAGRFEGKSTYTLANRWTPSLKMPPMALCPPTKGVRWVRSGTGAPTRFTRPKTLLQVRVVRCW